MPRRVIGFRLESLDALRQDVRFALRALRRSPGFAALAVAVLALGIAANTTIFSLVNAALFRPLPVPDAADLRFLSVASTRVSSPLSVPFPTFETLARTPDLFAGVAGYYGERAKIGTGLGASHVLGERVTAGYFDVLRAGAALGRTFVPADGLPGATPVVVISDRFWRRRLDADPNVLGTSIAFRTSADSDVYGSYTRAYTVIGVMPPGFVGLSSAWLPAEYWAPLGPRVEDALAGDREQGMVVSPATLERRRQVWVVARLTSGASEAAFRTAIFAAGRSMPELQWAAGSRGIEREQGTLVSAPYRGSVPFDQFGAVTPAYLALALLAVSGIVLLIAGTNLTGILLARAVARRGEIGVRLALGASRGRVVRQVLAETVLLSLAGTMGALVLARLFVSLFLAYMPTRIGPAALTVSLDVPIDLTVLVFTILLGVAAGIVIGLTPALQAIRTDVLPALGASTTAAPATARWRARRWIVAPQICGSLILLLAAGVLVRALLQAELGDRGFDPDGVVYADTAMPRRYSIRMTAEQRATEDARGKMTYMQLLERVRALPGVEHAALATDAPWKTRSSAPVITREREGQGPNHWVSLAEVSAGYFETMAIPIVRGRAFDARDSAAATPVAIVCERLAQLLWPGEEPVGKYIASHNPRSADAPAWLLVVGVAREVKLPGSEERPAPFLYLPIEQRPRIFRTSILVRARDTPADLVPPLAAAIMDVRPEAEVTRARMVSDDIAEVLYPRRLGAAILSLSALFGLLLAMVGLYGVVSYTTAQRMRELGIRAALGAGRRDILSLLMRDVLVTLAVAVTIGAALGFATVRVVSSIVVRLPALDAVTLVAVAALLAAVTLVACWLPARRGVRVDPVEVLRGL